VALELEAKPAQQLIEAWFGGRDGHDPAKSEHFPP